MIRTKFAHAVACAEASAQHDGTPSDEDRAAVYTTFLSAVAEGGWFLDCDDLPCLVRAYETVEGDGTYDLENTDAVAEATVALADWLGA